MAVERPTCINHGCTSLAVPCKGRVGSDNVRYRLVCGPCHEANYKGLPLRDGVTPFRQNKCANLDGRLGYPCMTNHDVIQDPRGKFQLDHIDGNSCNDHPDNIQELCVHCHQEKGMRNGDFNSKRETRSHAVKSKQRASSAMFFTNLFSVEQ